MSNRFDTTGKSKAMRKFERSTLVVQKVDPTSLAKPRNGCKSPLSPAQQEQVFKTGTFSRKLSA